MINRNASAGKETLLPKTDELTTSTRKLRGFGARAALMLAAILALASGAMAQGPVSPAIPCGREGQAPCDSSSANNPYYSVIYNQGTYNSAPYAFLTVAPPYYFTNFGCDFGLINYQGTCLGSANGTNHS